MSTKVTELIARITADSSQLKRELDTIKASTRDVGKVGKEASTATGDGLGHIGREAKKAGNEISGVLGAISELRTKGVAGIGDVIKEGAGLAGLFGPTGLIVGGIAVATVAIIGLFTKAASEAKEARKKIQEEMKELINSGDIEGIDKKLKNILVGTPANEFKDSKAAIQARIEQLKQENRETGKSIFSYSERTEEILKQLRRLKELTDQEKELLKARNLTEAGLQKEAGRGKTSPVKISADSNAKDAQQLLAVQKAAADLIATLSDKDLGNELDEAQRKIEEWVASAKKIGLTDKEIAPALKKINAAFGEFTKTKNDEAVAKTVAALEKMNDALGKQLTAAQDLQQTEVDRKRAAAQTTKDLEDEAKALAAGTEAYQLYLRTKAGETAVREARLRASAAGHKLSSQETIDIRTQALALYDLQEGGRQALAALSSNDAGKAAMALAEVADQATRIATSLGKGGENLGKIAGIAGVVASSVGGIQQALVKVDKLGNVVKGANGANQTVSFFNSLRGGNGKDSQAKSISSSVSIIGAIVAVANVFDLFGNKARAKAKALREAAGEFNAAIASFKTETARIGEQGVRAEISAVRDQLGQAVNDALKATGFGAISSSDASARVTQQQVDAFRQRAHDLVNSGDGDKMNEGGRLLEFSFALQEIVEQVAARLKAIAPKVLSALDTEFNDAIGNTQFGEIERATQHYNDTVDDLQQLLTYGAISQEQYNDGIAKAGTIYEHAKAVIDAAIKSAERAKVLDKLSSDNDILGGTAQQKLSRTLKAFAPLFDELNGIDGAKLGGADGLKALQARLIGVFETLSADGISDEEQPLVAAIKQILGLITDSLNELPNPFQNALDAFSEQIDVFGLSFAEQFAGLRKIFGTKFTELLGDAFDPSASGGLDGVKAKLQQRVAAILDDGVITDDEAPLLAALKQLLGAVNGMLDDAAKAAEDAAREAEAEKQRAAEARQARRNSASNHIAIDDLDDGDALRARIHGFGDAFESLFGAFDLDSLDGVNAAKAALKTLLHDVEGMSDDEVFAAFGLTRDELIAAMLDLDGGLDGLVGTFGNAAAAAKELANATKDFLDALDDDFLRATGHSQDADIKAAAKKRDDRIAKAIELGLGQDTINRINAIYADDVKRINDQYAQAVVDGAQTGSAAAQSKAATSASSVTSRTFVGTVDTSTLAVLSVLRQIEQSDRMTAANTSTLTALFANMRGSSPIQVPQIPSYLMPRFAGANQNGTSGEFSGTMHWEIHVHVTLPPGSVVIGQASDIGLMMGEAMKKDPNLVRVVDAQLTQLGGTKRRNQGQQ